MMSVPTPLKHLLLRLSQKGLQAHLSGTLLQVSSETQQLRCSLIRDQQKKRSEADLFFPFDKAVTAPEKLEALLLSKLQLNRVVYGRQCEVKRITKPVAIAFLNSYHVLNATSSATQYGLFYKDELLAVATFSSGRKMNRLSAEQRSFELIRFCSKAGYTVSGGLSKLIKHFVREKNPGDIMTYIDQQVSEGTSYLKAGFKKMGTTEPRSYCIEVNTYERSPLSNAAHCAYIFNDEGNLKLVLSVDSGMKK